MSVDIIIITTDGGAHKGAALGAFGTLGRTLRAFRAWCYIMRARHEGRGVDVTICWRWVLEELAKWEIVDRRCRLYDGSRLPA